MRVESGELRVEQLAKLLKNAFALHYFEDKFHEAIAAELVANGVRLEEKQATSNASEQFASDNHVGGKWIPVTERLPKEGEDVLVIGYWHEKFQPLMCYLSPHRKSEWFTSVAGQQVYTVTHWMPLPEPPKGE